MAAENLRRAAQVERAGRRADVELVEELFHEHHRLLYAYCLRRLRSPEEAEDAVQATYLNACRSLMQGFEPETAQAWLVAVAHNVCLTRIRSRSRRARVELAHDLDAVEDRLPAPEAGDELFGIDEALASLPEQQRSAILLREWQGLSYREVAAKLGVTQSAVEALIFRARRALAAALEEPPAPRRPRLLHSLDLGAALAGLKSSLSASLSGSLSASLATGVAVAASAAAVASGPLPAPLDPRVEAAPPVAAAVVEPPRSGPPVAGRAERPGTARWAGPKGKKPAKAAKGRDQEEARERGRGKRPERAQGKPAGAGSGPPAWAGSGQGPRAPQGKGGGRS